MRKRLTIYLTAAALLLAGALPVSAASELENPDGSYVFGYWGDTRATPIPYETEQTLRLSDLTDVQGFELENIPAAADLAVDEAGRFYIADSANSCVWTVDEDMRAAGRFDRYRAGDGSEQRLAGCEGVWAAAGKLYVANTGGGNLVVLDASTGETVQVVEAPSEEEWSSTIAFEPIRLSTDGGGRIYVISRNQTQGIVQFSKDGAFIGYLGALDVNPTAWDILIRTFGTAEMKKRTLQLVPTEFTNLVCDGEGMVLAITETVTDSDIYSAIQSRSGEKLPVRLLNPLGNDILKNRGYYPPVGDVDFTLYKNENSGASRFLDAAVGPNGLYSLLDRERGKVFTYDGDGNLLYVFGGLDGGEGKFQQPVSLVYRGDRIAVLDRSAGSLTLFAPTPFAQKVLAAYAAHDNGNAEEETACWEALEKEFGGYDLTSLGLGKALFNQGEYRAAMEKFRQANNKTYYSKALKGWQSQVAESYLGWLLAGAAAAAAAVVLLVKAVSRAVKRSGRPLVRSAAFGWTVMTHPFGGFWDLKWEKRGSVGGATLILLAAFVLRMVSARCVPYLFSDADLTQTNTLTETLSLGAVLLLFVLASWCLTTLFDGKGTIRDIYIYTCYSLTPYVLFSMPVLLLGQVLTLETASLFTSLNLVLVIYCGFLLVAGTLTVHQFTLGKTVLMLLISVAGVMLLIFLIVLCAGLAGNIVDFLAGVVKEITLRYA